MVIPLLTPLRTHSKPVVETSKAANLNHAFIFLRTEKGKQIIFRLNTVTVSVRGDKTTVCGRAAD